MKYYLYLVLFVMLFFHGCKKKSQTLSDTIQSELTLGMPDINFEYITEDLSGTIELQDKEGNITIKSKQSLYTESYKLGWVEFWVLFRQKSNLRDLANDEPEIRQEYGLQSRARAFGFNSCRKELASK